MTLISIAASGDSAEFITDSMAYTQNLGKLGHTSKSMPIPHLDAAVLGRGDSIFTAEAKSTLLHQSSMVETFDELLAAAPTYLRDLQRHVIEDLGDTFINLSPVAMYLVGWSHQRNKFEAHYLAQEDDFEPTKISGLHTYPASWAERPTKLELSRLQKERPTDELAEFWKDWQAKPKRPVPRDIKEWAGLADEIRYTRSLQDFAKTIVGGSLYYTRLERESITTIRLFDFNDTGDELLQLVGWNQHPVTQQRPCHCDSGKTFLECHLADYYADGHPCDCGSGKPFGECCSEFVGRRVGLAAVLP
jgi:hypothetical protein